MKTEKLILLITMTMLQSIAAFASGNGAGNGGSGWVCRENNPAETIRWVRLLDTWEAENDPHRKYSFTNSSYEDNRKQVNSLTAALPGNASSNFETDLLLFEQLIQHGKTSSGVRIVLPTDASIKFFPSQETCIGGILTREAIALYDVNQNINVNADLYQKLSPTDQFGLVLHEQMYAKSRDFDEMETSDFAREVVANLLRAASAPLPEETTSALTRWYNSVLNSSRVAIEFDAYSFLPIKDQIPVVDIDGIKISFDHKTCKQVATLSEKKAQYRCKVTAPKVFIGFSFTSILGRSQFGIRSGTRSAVSSHVRVRVNQGAFWIEEQFDIQERNPNFGRSDIEIRDRLAIP